MYHGLDVSANRRTNRSRVDASPGEASERSRELLAGAYNRFQEGFDTIDLREARRELEALGGVPDFAPAAGHAGA